MKRSIVLVAALAVSVALVAGCGSSTKKTSSSPATTPATTPAATTPAPGGANVIDVKMANIAFSPATIHAKIGQTIKWTNEDGVDHNVTATKGDNFKSPAAFGQGGTFSYKIDHAGTIKFVCTLHPATMSNGLIIATK